MKSITVKNVFLAAGIVIGLAGYNAAEAQTGKKQLKRTEVRTDKTSGDKKNDEVETNISITKDDKGEHVRVEKTVNGVKSVTDTVVKDEAARRILFARLGIEEPQDAPEAPEPAEPRMPAIVPDAPVAPSGGIIAPKAPVAPMEPKKVRMSKTVTKTMSSNTSGPDLSPEDANEQANVKVEKSTTTIIETTSSEDDMPDGELPPLPALAAGPGKVIKRVNVLRAPGYKAQTGDSVYRKVMIFGSGDMDSIAFMKFSNNPDFNFGEVPGANFTYSYTTDSKDGLKDLPELPAQLQGILSKGLDTVYLSKHKEYAKAQAEYISKQHELQSAQTYNHFNNSNWMLSTDSQKATRGLCKTQQQMKLKQDSAFQNAKTKFAAEKLAIDAKNFSINMEVLADSFRTLGKEMPNVITVTTREVNCGLGSKSGKETVTRKTIIREAKTSRKIAVRNKRSAADNIAPNAKDLVLSPNPAKDHVNISIKNAEPGVTTELSLTDMAGREIKHQTLNITGAFSHDLDLNDLQPGIYIVKLVQGKHSYASKLNVER